MEQDWYWCTDRMASDIFHCLREREMSLPTYVAQSPQLDQRRLLVDWLSIIWEKYELCKTTRQLAVLLMDLFMDQFNIEARQLHLVALGSLLVSCKFEEKEMNIPRICDLNKYVPEPGFTPDEFLQMELLLLDFNKWLIGLPTAAHFTDYFLQFAQDDSSVRDGKPLKPNKTVFKHLQQYTDYFLEISMQDHFYRDYRPSLVAAACIVAAKKCLRLIPILGDRLEKATMYTWGQLDKVVQAMLKTHRQDELQTASPPPPPPPPVSVFPTPPPTPKHDRHTTTSISPSTPPICCYILTPTYQGVELNTPQTTYQLVASTTILNPL